MFDQGEAMNTSAVAKTRPLFRVLAACIAMSQIAIVPLLIYWSMTVTAPAWAAPLALFMGLMCLSNAVGFAGGALTGEMFRFRRHERKEAEMKPTWTDSYYYRRHGFAGLRWFYRIWFSLMFLILAGLLAAVVWLSVFLPEPKGMRFAVLALPLWFLASVLLARMCSRFRSELATVELSNAADSR
jgi:hypothetical protein